MTEQLPLSDAWRPVRLRVEDYLLLDGSGAFDGYGRTELIDGEIFAMNAQYRPHARIKTKLAAALIDALVAATSTLEVLVEPAVAIPPDGMPEPDILLTSEPDGAGFVPLASVALVVEVSDSTLDGDLGRKAALYARGEVPEYWVADVNARVIHQLWRPVGASYTERRTVTFGDSVEAVTISGLTIPTASL